MDIPLFVDEEIKYYAVEVSKKGYQKIQIENIEIFTHIHTCIHIGMRPLWKDDTPVKKCLLSYNKKKPCEKQLNCIKKFTLPSYVALFIDHHWIYLDGKAYLKGIANANVNPTWPLDILKSTIKSLLMMVFQQIAVNDKAHGMIYEQNDTAFSLSSWPQPSYDLVNTLFDEVLNELQDEWILPVEDSFHSSIRSMEDIIYHKQPDITSIQRYGTQGECMENIQICLSFLANFFEELPPLRITHLLDEDSKQAIIAFQMFAPMQTDITLDTILANLLTICSDIINLIDPHEAISNYPDSLQDMKIICMIQRAINTVASIYPAIPNILVDGIMHERCVYAIKVFQELFQIHADGMINENTWRMLFTTAFKIEEGIHITQGMPPFPDEPLTLGAHGSSVLLIQNRLRTISNLYSSIPFIDSDACFGVATHQCILAFQDLLGLKKDGVLDHFTWTLLHQVYEEIIRI